MSKVIKNSKYQFSLNFGSRCFAPSLKLSIITLVLFCILVYLGIWQIQRALYKNNLLQTLQSRVQETPKELSVISEPSLEKDRFKHIDVEGVFLNNFTFLLDNQMLDHKPGFRVLTVLQSPRLEKWLLIDLGWIPLGNSRAELPDIPIIYGVKKINGIINTISCGTVLQADDTETNNTWPNVIQNLDYSYIESKLRHPVYEFVIQIQAADFNYFPYPPIDYGFNSDKNWGYAFQWFIFALLVLLYYLINSIKRRG